MKIIYNVLNMSCWPVSKETHPDDKFDAASPWKLKHIDPIKSSLHGKQLIHF